MTPEQEILSDALAAVGQRATNFARELADHAPHLPLDENISWSDPRPELTINVVAFMKRYEMMQDQITRKLFRSVLAVQGAMLRTQKLGEVVSAMAAIGIVSDAPRWNEITKLRNTFAHDYMLTFAKLVPLINLGSQMVRRRVNPDGLTGDN